MKKTKKQSKQIELRIEAEYPEISQKKLIEFIEQEHEMQSTDRAEKEKSHARNALEEYIYDFRDKIHGDYSEYIAEADREKFSGMLTKTEDWLYSEGEDQPKSSYSAKLEELKLHGHPLVNRYREHQEREPLINDMYKYMQLSRKAVDSYLAGDEKLSHLEKADIDKVTKTLMEKQQWLDDKMNSQRKLPLHADPALTVSQIRSEKDHMEQTINSILNRPKPTQPKAEVKAPGDNQLVGDNSPTPAGNGDANAVDVSMECQT